ncbi:MAG: sugar phosphate isomerase/epimerase [Clostridia bacterium]|nr:sugar phosphate isomerase/epimerase [Clostridia bacterium]
MQIGVTIPYRANTVILDELKKAKEIGLQSCQLSIWDMSLYTDEKAAEINAAVAETGITISTLWCGYSGPVEWNFTYGPMVNGLVPPAYRFLREKELLLGSEFAMKLGVNQIATHVGFLPENYYDADFRGTVASIKKICTVLKERNQWFLFETGQETPVTVLRAIEEIGMDNVGINFDTANVMLYGKGNAADAVLVFGKYIRDVHIKDGFYPTDGMHLGKECAAGDGLANFPLVLKRLKDCGYTGPYTIEREIKGEEQRKDVIKAKNLLLEIEKTL